MTTIAIIGLGLIGGSIGEALKNKGLASKIIGIPRREETIGEAKQHTAIDEGTLDISKVSEADIIFICTPLNLIIPKLKEIMPHLKNGAIVTDVGSSKNEIVKAAGKIMKKGCFFVGGHPMAGKEKTGIAVSDPGLFNERTWILTETTDTNQDALRLLQHFIDSLGAKVVILDPKAHDEAVAAISHLPLAIAAALVNTIATQEGKDAMIKCAASGFRDTTRVASGDPVLGRDMFTTNKTAVIKMIKAYKQSLTEIEKLVKEGKADAILAKLKEAKEFRDQIYNG